MTQFQVPLSRTAPAVVRHEVESLSASLRPASRAELLLLVSEVVTNSVEHSGAPAESPIEVTIAIEPRKVTVRVCDEGTGDIDVPAAPGAEATSGYGLVLVDRLSARWGIDQAMTNCVWFVLDLVPA